MADMEVKSANNSDFQKSIIESALRNSLVLSLVCSNTNSVKDLFNFRLVNRAFYREATKRLRSIHKPIKLQSEFDIKPFLRCIQTRFDPDINPFPFAAFRIFLGVPNVTLKVLLKSIGEHIRRLELSPVSDNIDQYLDPRQVQAHAKRKLPIILPSTPNLEDFQLTTHYPVHLDPRDLTALPASYPLLRNIRIYCFWELDSPSTSTNTVPLLSHFITRARVLDHVHIPRISYTQGQGQQSQTHMTLNAVRLILQHHSHHLPSVSLSKTSLVHTTLPVLQELTEMGLTFRNFSIALTSPYIHHWSLSTDKQVRNIINCVTWLGAQTSLVTSLSVDLWKAQQGFSIAIPPLSVLAELRLSCCSWVKLLNDQCPIQPVVTNQFPVLRKLSLDHYRDSFGIFDHCSLPSVQELHIQNQLVPLTGPWHIILPNLSALHFQVSLDSDVSESEDGANLGFLLKHFPRITRLEVNLGNWKDYWDILTGGAPRSLSSRDLLYGALDGDLGELEEPVKGVYRIPSLRNLRALKTLRCWPGSRRNLDAILYMTRAGLLVPLQRIELLGITGKYLKIEYDEGVVYHTELTKVHTKVNFGLKLDGPDQVKWWKRYEVSPELLPDFISCHSI